VSLTHPATPTFIEHPLDLQDLARTLTSFRGLPRSSTPTVRHSRVRTGDMGAYVFDEESGMVYILD
jgi:hypothetical protein